MKRKIKIGIYNFIKEINSNYKVKFQKEETEVDIPETTIYIGKQSDKESEWDFIKFANQINPNCKYINPFLLTILHEIGHIKTWNQKDDDERSAINTALEIAYNKKLIKYKTYCNMYFNIPLERKATEWAINFALSHLDLIDKYSWLHN